MRPRLIHPRPITLYRRDTTPVDVDFGPTGTIHWKDGVILQGQVHYSKYDRIMPTGAGNDPQSEGYVVFGIEEWEQAGGKEGDEMELSPSSSRLIITEVRPAAHYYGKPYHVHVYFTRRTRT